MISFLVPFEEDTSGLRTRPWNFVRAKLIEGHPEADIQEHKGDGSELFNRAYALNRAAEKATGDVFVVMDSDTWTPPKQIYEAVLAVRDKKIAWAKASQFTTYLSEQVSARYYRQEHELIETMLFDDIVSNDYGAPCVIRREDWERLGGMDERFRGWGGEDVAFGVRLRNLVGPGKVLLGTYSYHLWHGAKVEHVEDLETKRALAEEYKEAYK